ncbi:MAG: glycosyl transferase [Bacteroidales bacterium]|nr:glycosyl transferase [Bacteroidales bacterium]
MTVGLLYVATGKYTLFWKDFYITAKKFLFPDVPKRFFVFTDLPEVYGEDTNSDITRINIEHREWPYNTLLRFEIFEQNLSLFENCDYLLFYNANTFFADTIQPEEILPTEDENYLVVLSNNDLYNIDRDKYTYDRNPLSLAYIPYGQGTRYYRGCFNGGRTPEFIKLIQTCKANTEQDLKAGIIALWHDESHLNKYLLNKKIKIVGTEYGKPEEWRKPKKAKVYYVDKKKVFGSDELKKFKNTPRVNPLIRFSKKIMRKIIP